MNWFDWLLVAILAMTAARGWMRGLVRVVVGLLRWVISVVVAGRFAPLLVGYATQWGWKDKVAAALAERLPLPEDMKMPDIPVDHFRELLAQLPLPESYRAHLIAQFERWAATVGAGQTGAEFLYGQLAQGLLNIAAFTLLVAVTAVTLALVADLVSRGLKKVPVVGTVNQLAGAALSALGMAFAMGVVLSLWGPLLSFPQMKAIAEAQSASRLAPSLTYLYLWLGGRLFGEGGFLV